MQLPKAYSPQDHEKTIYSLWEDSDVFKPSTAKGDPFTIIMPPPNANGSLHAGHLMFVVEDLLTRYARMNGRPTLWLPGTDHAGIETQFVYERDVLGPQGKTRFDVGPDKFYQDVMEFVESSGGTIIDQMRSMGFSADWSRLKFTLDEDIVETVYETFARLHEDGHIYRGNRIVNWCPRCEAAFADIELEREERESELIHIDYGPIQIATVRPETIFADVAIAVNPEDDRYSHLIGEMATIPIINRPIPIIADDYVESGFGTGALKITPGHDPNDYEIGLRHNLPEITVIDGEGRLINVPEEYAGLSVEEGREKVISELDNSGSLVKREDYTHAVALHDRCGSGVEPLISEQWFLRIKDLNRPVIDAIENEEIRFHPPRFKKIALDWLKQEHDWCISRQIWWGIRIPVYYKTSHDPDKKPYIISPKEQEAIDYYGAGNYTAETDTFDTWFSSGQWPFATLLSTGDFDNFYPTSVMGTARDILHKWVTRMIMFGLYRTGEVPFKDVYLWGMVTDEYGKKLSKSKGNYGDPMEITAAYGTDALRLALTASNTPGSNSALTEKQVEAMRNFCNKLWNVARYVLEQADVKNAPRKLKPESLADKWFVSRVNQQAAHITELIESYRFNEATDTIYHLLWDDFADWYIEASKISPNRDVLAYGLETILRLVHPFAPFVTEAIWQQIPWRDGMLATAEWPDPADTDEEAMRNFSQLQTLIGQVRHLVAQLDEDKPALYHSGEELLQDNAELITQLAPVQKCEYVSDGRGLPVPNTPIACWLDVEQHTIEAYLDNLNESLEETNSYINKLQARLENKAYTHNAPKEVVNDTKQSLKDAQARSETLSRQIKQIDT